MTEYIKKDLEQQIKTLHEAGVIRHIENFVNDAVEEKLQSLKSNKRFKAPEIEEVFMHFTEVVKSKYPDLSENRAQAAIQFCKNEAEKFCNFYESKNWHVGKNKMKKWKAAASNWMVRAIDDNSRKENNSYTKKSLPNDFTQTDFYKNL